MKKVIISFFCLAPLIAGDAKTYTVDVNQTSLRWKGMKVTGSHWGYVTMAEGLVIINGKNIIAGEFSVDLNSMTEEEMGDSPWKIKLLNHLKSDDFFDVTNHPVVRFKLTRATFNQGAFKFKGDMTIRGITHPVEFPAVVRFSDQGPSATGQIVIDRTNYNMKYRSGKYFPDVGDKMIYDEFTIDFSVQTK